MDWFDIRSAMDFETAHADAVAAVLGEARAGSLIAFEFAVAQDLSSPDLFEPRGKEGFDQDFEEFVRLRVAHLIDDALHQLQQQVDPDGWIVVHRAMVVDPRWFDVLPDESRLGLCWAWSEAEAVAHDAHRYEGDMAVDARLRGFVHAKDVDWTTTVSLNASDDYATGTENEIRINKGAVVELDRIEWRADPHDDYAEVDPCNPPSVLMAQAATTFTA